MGIDNQTLTKASREASRETTLAEIGTGTLDVLVMGGGVNGAGIIRDLALRSSKTLALRLALVEQRHFSSGTSGRNSQLIHGGLRYLKNFELKLVSEALAERAILLKTAPHLVEPLAFLIPMRDLFSAVFYGAGLFLYDFLAGKNRIEPHGTLTGKQLHEVEPRIGRFSSGARFFDCRVHSARLVILNIRDAVARGAHAINYVVVESCEKGDDGLWHVDLFDTVGQRRISAKTRSVVDATGAWSRTTNLRLVRGSHIILPRIGTSENAVSYFGRDGRIVFFIPWGRRHEFTLIGTTDVDHEGGPDKVRISPEEVRYLLNVVEEVFPGTGPHRPMSAYSSLRPLVRDESASATRTSREHRIWADQSGMVHVTGGKYTTYRLMSEEASDLVAKTHWPQLAADHGTGHTPICGNTPEAVQDLLKRTGELAQTFQLDQRDVKDLVKDYGVESIGILEEMPEHASSGVSRLEAAQIAFAVRNEFVQRLTDLMFISTYWGYEKRWTPGLLKPFAREMGQHLQWNDATIIDQIDAMLAMCDQPSAS